MTIPTIDDAPTTSSALEGVDKAALATRIIKNSTQLLEDYVLWHECGWSDEEFGGLLGISAKTVKNRYLADARKQGLIEPSKMARPNCARNRAQTVENSTPTSTTTTTVFTNDQQVSAPVQRSNTEHLLSRDIPAVQSNVDIYCGGRAEAVEALGTNHEGTNDAKRTYTEICRLLDQACSKLYDLEAYPIDDSVWASVRGHINACAAVADCHRVSEDVLPLRNITDD